MTETRKLATVLFADIAGYTSLMQTDEKQAMLFLKDFKEILEKIVPLNHGEIIQYYGDAVLLTFDSARDGVECSMSLQEAFIEKKIPIRIGLHLGDVVFKNDNVFGNGVNIASRIESIGIPGSILISKAIRDQISNKSEFQLTSLGSFEFKNVEEPMEVFALTNKGFVIPKREEMQGKLKSQDTSGSFFQKIWRKRIPQILGIYILVAWLGLQIFDWAFLQFGISPHWGQVFFITFLGIIPSLLVYLNNRERIHQSQLMLGEKILFPTNIIGLGIVLFFMFRGVDLGATSQTFTFINPEGVKETHQILKNEFRQEIHLFPFEPMQVDSAYLGLVKAIPYVLQMELSQDKYLSPTDWENPPGASDNKVSTIEKIEATKLSKGDFYIDGNYQASNQVFEITPMVRNKMNGKIHAQRTFKGNNFPSLIDSMSIYLRLAIGLSQSQIDQSIDLKCGDYLSENVEAIQNLNKPYKRLKLEKAIALDSTMAQAYNRLAYYIYYFSNGDLEAKVRIAQAMKYRKKLPFHYQIGIMTSHHLIHKEWERAEQLLKIQLEIKPNDPEYINLLQQVYRNNFELDKLTRLLESQYANIPNTTNEFRLMEVLLMNGRSDEVISHMKSLLQLAPQNINTLRYLAEAYIQQGAFNKAKETVDKIILINPEIAFSIGMLSEAAEYMKEHPTTPEDLSKFVGFYRSPKTEMLLEFSILNNHICFRANNQEGLFMYPAGENILKYGVPNKGFQCEVLLNKEGEVYTIKFTESHKERDLFNYRWKQDSTIWNAETFLRDGDYENARKAYATAIEQHPEHFYLYQAKQHLDYLQANSEEAVQQNFQKIVGKFGESKIWIDNGLLFYKRLGETRRILRPLSNNRFMTLLNYAFNYEIIKQNGKIVGIQGHRYYPQKKEWEKVSLEDSNYPRQTELRD